MKVVNVGQHFFNFRKRSFEYKMFERRLSNGRLDLVHLNKRGMDLVLKVLGEGV